MTAPQLGLSFRGGPVRADVGDVLVEPGFLATSLDPRVATDNFDDATVLAVASASGRLLGDVSDVPAEAEVVHRPGSRVLVVGRGEVDGVDVVVGVVQDGAPDPDHEQLVGVVVDRIRAARAEPPVDLPRTGRFRGAVGGG